MWTLVLIARGKGLSSDGLAISHVPGFTSNEACETAGKLCKEKMKKEDSYNELTFISIEVK